MAKAERLDGDSHDNLKKINKKIPFLGKSAEIAFTPLLMGLILGGATIYGINENIKETRNIAAITRELEQYPEIPQDLAQAARKETQDYEAAAKKLGQEGNIDQLPNMFDQESLKKSYEVVVLDSAREDLEWKRRSQDFSKTSIIAAGGGSIVSFLIAINPIARIDRRRMLKDETLNALLTFRPEWEDNPPTKEELVKFYKALSYLPPMGGKIPLIISKEGVAKEIGRKLYPSLTAEQQIENVIGLRQKGELGKAYVHQLSVQGRLPDRFKYAAIALILNSPYASDWSEPFFDAPWGEASPMIHDGGITDQNMSSVWHNVEGRTDFIERIARVYAPDLEQKERLEVKEKAGLPNLPELLSEREEKNRLILEAKVYQRLALALHSKVGIAPKEIPQDIRTNLSMEWDNFERRLGAFLEHHEIFNVAAVEWFRESPIYVKGWPSMRRESDWPPIQRELIRLEEAKKNNPQIRTAVSKLLIDTTDRIDRTIGLLA